MNSRISLEMTCPGTRIGKPGGYGMMNEVDTSSRPLSMAAALERSGYWVAAIRSLSDSRGVRRTNATSSMPSWLSQASRRGVQNACCM